MGINDIYFVFCLVKFRLFKENLMYAARGVGLV